MEIRDLQGHFLSVIEGARDTVGLYDLDGRPLYVNHRSLFGEDPAQSAQGGDPFIRIHPQDRERVRAEYAEIVRSAEPRRLEFRGMTTDGSIRLLQSESNPVRDESGRTIAVLCIARNVTEERRGEAAVKATLETLFEQAPVGIGITDTSGTFVRANGRLQRLLGYSDEALRNRSLWDVTHPDDRALVEQLLGDIGSGRLDRFAIEKRIVRSDGEIRWVTCVTAIVQAPLGGERLTVEVVDDVTEGKLMQQTLAEREALLELIFQHAPISIAITDRDARFVRVNARYQCMLGYTAQELSRLTGWDVVYQDDAEANRKQRDELWSGARDEYTWERRYVRKSGEVLWTRNTVSLIRDMDGSPLYALALIEDISQRKLSDAAIHSTTEKLQALTRRLVDLQESERREMSRELHDRVGQTLTAMRINMDMIRTRLDEHDDAVIRSRNEDSLELIESAFSAVQDVMYDLRPPMIDEFGLVAPLQWYAKRFAERTGIRVDVRGPEGWRFDPAVELALFRIAQEALNNVGRHAQARNVVIELREPDSEINFSITDNGVGFTDGERPSGPAGYGLITMRERAEAVGGRFDASSEPGKGARLTVRVPVRP